MMQSFCWEMFLESLLIALNIKRIISIPFGTLLSKVDFKEKEEKDQGFKRLSQELGQIEMVVGDGLVQTISESRYREYQNMF